MSFFEIIKRLIFSGSMGKRHSVSQVTESKIKQDWEEVKVLMNQKNPSQLRQALIIADKSLDNALRDVFDGESMGERLKLAKDKFDRDLYNKIWEAHKVRNNLVHESGYEPPYFVVIQAINDLKNGLYILGVRV